MSAPNVNTLWGLIVADALAAAGVEAVCATPGSRSTPLTVAVAEHPHLRTFSHLDERSSAFFAVGRGKRTGRVTPLICTSGTAVANMHPAVVEADGAGVPLLLLTADRPPELSDSGANQTIDQEGLFGTAVRHYRTLPEPGVADRTRRALRTTVCRAVATAEDERGPVHLNVPFRKPLSPTVETDDVPVAADTVSPAAGGDRDGPFVEVEHGDRHPGEDLIARLGSALAAAERPLVVAGPSDDLDPDAIAALARVTGAPLLADPLSGLRFGPHVGEDVLVCGGYDVYLQADLPDPDIVLRVGASPTSKPLRHYLRDADCRQVVVAPAGWPEAEFTATDLLRVDPSVLTRQVADRFEAEVAQLRGEEAGERSNGPRPHVADWHERFADMESRYWEVVDVATHWEGGILADVARYAPDPATLFVSNSMPVRDLDRFGRPRSADLTVYGNRGASGIDGITSTALGVGSAADEPLVLAIGDLAYYHDMNGLLAIQRCDLDATIVVLNNDGGGIFRILPIADHPTFEDHFLAPHGLDFEPTADLYGLGFDRTDDRDRFRDLYRAALESDGTRVIEVRTDSEASHGVRADLRSRVLDRFRT